MEVTTVQELIDALQKVDDKTLPVRILNSLEPDAENIWIHSIEVTNDNEDFRGQSGEVRILGTE